MSKTKSFSELKRMARLQMQGKMGTLIGAMFLYLLINTLITEIVARVIAGDTLSGTIILHIVSYIVELILATLVAGQAYLRLNIACKHEGNVSDIFYVAKNHPDKVIKIQAVITLINIVLSIPAYMYNYKYGLKFVNYYLDLTSSILTDPYSTHVPAEFDALAIMGLSATTFLAYFILICVCAILVCVVTIAFFPAFYLMLDFPQMEPMEVIKKSWELMKGYKFRYLLLQLSFLPYFILSLFTFLIPLIWVIPYMHMTNTNFYLDLVSYKYGNANTVEVVDAE